VNQGKWLGQRPLITKLHNDHWAVGGSGSQMAGHEFPLSRAVTSVCRGQVSPHTQPGGRMNNLGGGGVLSPAGR